MLPSTGCRQRYVRELQEGSHSTTFVFAAGHSFCDGVWIRSTGRASETSNQIAAQLRRIKARGFIVHPGISVDALLALANLIRELSRRQPTAPPVTWTDFPIAGIQFIPSDEDESDADRAMYEQAKEFVIRDNKASTSYVQRRLKIGYNRAARLIEKMEAEGIVGPANHVGKREVLVR